MTAPPMPWMTRKPISIPPETESAQPAEASVNTATPLTNTRLRPKWSPSAPPSGISVARVSAYALTTHSSPPGDRCSWCCMDGSATLTIMTSSTIMPCARHATVRVSRCAWRELSEGEGPWPAVLTRALPPPRG